MREEEKEGDRESEREGDRERETEKERERQTDREGERGEREGLKSIGHCSTSVKEREREKERVKSNGYCCTSVKEREREREREGKIKRLLLYQRGKGSKFILAPFIFGPYKCCDVKVYDEKRPAILVLAG